MNAPVLVFGWGNRARGDDALGPLAIERLRANLPANAPIEFLEDYQLLPEHALDLVGRARVLFIDASVTASAPFELSEPVAAVDTAWTSHALSPAALLRIHQGLRSGPVPPCTLLAIRGERFGLGDPLSPLAARNLQAAVTWALGWLAEVCRASAAACP